MKVYSDVLHWKMEKEVFVYDRLAVTPLAVPVPMVLAADDSKALMAQNVLVMSKLDGDPVTSLLDQIDDDQLTHINRQIGGILSSLHQVGFEHFGYVGTDGIMEPHETNLAYIHFQFEKKLREFANLGGDLILHDAIERHVAECEELFAACDRPSFCHGEGALLFASSQRGTARCARRRPR